MTFYLLGILATICAKFSSGPALVLGLLELIFKCTLLEVHCSGLCEHHCLAAGSLDASASRGARGRLEEEGSGAAGATSLSLFPLRTLLNLSWVEKVLCLFLTDPGSGTGVHFSLCLALQLFTSLDKEKGSMMTSSCCRHLPN